MVIKRTDGGSATPAPAPFTRPMLARTLRRDTETPFRISAEPEECTALARYLAVNRIDRLSFAGFIAPAGSDGWRVRGRVVAKIEQSCVVTLEPVLSRFDIEVERLYLPADRLGASREVQVGADDDDAPDPYTDSVDPAALALEALALAIDPYPRAEGAELSKLEYAAPGEAPEASDSPSNGPFAGLAALRDRGAKGRG